MLPSRILPPLIAVIGLAALAVNQLRPPSVTVARVEAGRVEDVVYATGTVQPERETKVAPEVAGRIAALYASEGDEVRLGRPLARLDATDAEGALREAERRLETARARLAQAGAPTDPQTVEQLGAQVGAARARERAAQEGVEAAEDRITASRSTARAAEAGIESARARARAARENLRAAEAEIESARERAEAARAEGQQAVANLSAARDLHERRLRLFREGAIAERAVAEAQTAFDAAGAALQAARNRARSAERTAAGAAAAAEAARAQAEDAEAAVETARANHAAALAQVSEARSAARELRGHLEAQGRETEALRSQLRRAERGPLPVDVNVVRAEVRSQEAAVARARQSVARHTVLAPVSGRVTSRPAEEGDYVPVGTRLFTVAGEERIYIRADVDEADIGQVRVGSPVRFQVDAHPGRVYAGQVALVGRSADASTKTYPVDVRQIADPTGLRLGMTADVNIRGRVTGDAVLVPLGALRTENDRTLVWVVDSESRVRARTVRVRARDARQAQVLEGLRPGERVVLDPTSRLQEGRTVRVLEPEGGRRP